MATVARLNPDSFPDSPYARELQRGVGNHRFCEPLETAYELARLRDSQTLIRVTCLLTIVVALLRDLEQFLRGDTSLPTLLILLLVMSSSIVLTVLAWGPAFERRYQPWAHAIVPPRNALVAFTLAVAAARGHLEILMGLPILLSAPFFVLGLRIPTAVIAAIGTLVVFTATALWKHLPPLIVFRCASFLALALIACFVAAQHFERTSRKAFLEGHLIAELAQHDALTGAKNRRMFDEHLARLWHQAIDAGRSLAILLVDVDHFKAYNDRYGHLAGDQTLRQVARTLQRFVRRPLDLLARYGGEEFAVLLYDVEPEQARMFAERLCRSVADLGIEHQESRTACSVTISAGVAVIKPALNRNPKGALQLADEALYGAKMSGRNRVEVMEDEEYSMLVTGVFARG
jgi:diguanylate cyclase (GGDEF)-like protein